MSHTNSRGKTTARVWETPALSLSESIEHALAQGSTAGIQLQLGAVASITQRMSEAIMGSKKGSPERMNPGALSALSVARSAARRFDPHALGDSAALRIFLRSATQLLNGLGIERVLTEEERGALDYLNGFLKKVIELARE